MERRHVPHRAQRNTLQKVGRQSSRRDFVPDGGTRGTIRLISTCDIVVLTRACVLIGTRVERGVDFVRVCAGEQRRHH